MNKKLLKVFASFAFVTLALAGCNDTNTSSAEPSSPINSESSTPEDSSRTGNIASVGI